MNSDRIIKILEWRTQISASSSNTYDPDDRKDLEECMLDVFNKFCDLKKKKYNLTLGTSLDTQELEDMDMAILLCIAETAFGIKQIPADDLKKMQTFYDVADYVSKHLPPKSECSGCKKAKETTAKPKAETSNNNGCLASSLAVFVFFLCFPLTSAFGGPFVAWFLSFAAAAFVYNVINKGDKPKTPKSKSESKPTQTFAPKNNIGCAGWLVVFVVWMATVIGVGTITQILETSEDVLALSVLIGSTIAAIVTYMLLKRCIATNNEDIPNGAQKESDENSNNKASKTFIDIVLVAVAWLIAYLVVYSIANYALGASEEVSASVGSCAGAIGAICMYMFRHRRKSDDANDIL